MGKYRKFKVAGNGDDLSAGENGDDVLTELDTLIEKEEKEERNPFALYEDEDRPDTEKATQEIKDVIDKLVPELSSVMSKWKEYGAHDSASVDAIIKYIGENL